MAVKCILSRADVAKLAQQTSGSGPEGVITAIIRRAMLDATKGSRSALQFFESDDYRHYIELLGLPSDWLPDGIVRVKEHKPMVTQQELQKLREKQRETLDDLIRLRALREGITYTASLARWVKEKPEYFEEYSLSTRKA